MIYKVTPLPLQGRRRRRTRCHPPRRGGSLEPLADLEIVHRRTQDGDELFTRIGLDEVSVTLNVIPISPRELQSFTAFRNATPPTDLSERLPLGGWRDRNPNRPPPDRNPNATRDAAADSESAWQQMVTRQENAWKGPGGAPR